MRVYAERGPIPTIHSRNMAASIKVPHQVGNARPLTENPGQVVVLDEPQFAWRHRHHAVIHDLEVQALKVRNVPGRVERKIWRLPSSVNL